MRSAVSVLIAASLGLAARAGAAEAAKLRVAVEDEAAPWSDRDGTGYANDLVVAAFRAVGVEIELAVTPYERCKRMVVHGDVAACFSMSWDPELEPAVLFPRAPLFSCEARYFEAVARPVAASRQAELPRGTAIATVRAYEYPQEFTALVQAGALRVEESVSEEIALRRLAEGRVDLALVNVDPVLKRPEVVLRRAGVLGAVRARFAAGVLPSYIGFSRKHPRGAWALARFEEGLRRIQEDGRAARIAGTWRARAAPPPPRDGGRP